MISKLKNAKDKALDVAADVANTNIDRAVAAKNSAIAAKDNAVALKQRIEQDGIAQVSSEISHDVATSVKNSAINTVNNAKNMSKTVYQNAKEMNLQKAKLLMMNEAFSRITNSKSKAKPPVLLATAELDATLQQCKEDIEKIVNDCKAQKTKYTDEAFPKTNDSLYADPEHPSNEFGAPKDWKRISDLKKEPCVFKDKPKPDNIDQGDVGTCFLLGSLGVLAMESGLIQDLFIAYDIEVGVYGVRFFINDHWRAVIIDDYLPVNEHGVILYGASKDRDEFWVALIEKAYAKLHMCYEHIDGGVERYAMCDLTGGVGERYQVNGTRGGINMAGLWKGNYREGKVGLPKDLELFISFLGGRIFGGGYLNQALYDITGEISTQPRSRDLTFELYNKDASVTEPTVFTGKYDHEKFALVGSWKGPEGSGVFELTMIEKKKKKEIKGADALNMFSDLWSVILERSKEKVLMTCAIEDPSDTETETKLDNGLLKNHAYGVTAVYELNGYRFVRLMNPHGKGRWNGRWSPGSSEMNIIYKKLLSVKDEDDGIFFMLYEDFIAHFNALDLCVIFNEDWHVSTIRGMWRTSMCGGEDNWPNNPQAQIIIQEKTKVIIKLSQPTPKIYSGVDYYPIGIGFNVVYCHEYVDRIKDFDNCVVLATVEPVYERSVSISITLTPLEFPYYIVPYTTDPALICPFTLSVYANSDFNLVDLSHNIDTRIPSGLWRGEIGEGETKRNIALQVEFEKGGCIATRNEDEVGDYLLKGGFIESETSLGDFSVAFEKEYDEQVEEVTLFTGEYSKKTTCIEGKYSKTDIEGNPISEEKLTLKFCVEETFVEELGLLVEIVTDNLNQYRIGLKKWFEDVFPVFFENDAEVSEEMAETKGRSEMARVKGRAEMARVKGRSEMARVKGRAEMSRVKGRAEMARVKGRAEMARIKGRSEMSRVKGRSEMSRVKGRAELVRVKGSNRTTRLPEAQTEAKTAHHEAKHSNENGNGNASSPPPQKQTAPIVQVGGGMCSGSKICIIQ